MPEISLPTKATQDAIKQDTTNILSQFPISGGTDWSKYSPIQNSSQVVLPGTSTTNILNITGSGYLDIAFMLQIASPGNIRLKVTIDGQVVHHSGGVIGSNIVIGLLNTEFLLNDGTTGIAKVLNPYNKTLYTFGSINQHPYTSQGGGVSLLTKPIFFKSSCLVQIENIGTGSPTVQVFANGGIG